MRATPSRDTKPELMLRRELWRRGVRGYRVHWPIAGTRRSIDIAWPGRRIALFVDGCFWHGCPRHGRITDANRTWWTEKIAANAQRDADTTMRLRTDGWSVLRVWEHVPVLEAVNLIAEQVAQRTEGKRKPHPVSWGP